ncbi:MAG: amino acid ABC transporter permease [Anaerovoracaceae bacterium]
MSYVLMILPPLLKGAVITVELFIVTLLFSLPLGLPVALGENCRILPIRWICKFYVFIFRGTPLMLQLFFFYFFFPMYLGIQTDSFTTAAFTFVLNYAAYFAEIYRGGLNSIDRGQYEASHSLGLGRGQTLFGIVLPQMFRIVLPPISNEVITLIKDTALASSIALVDIMRQSEGIVNRDGSLTAYLIAACLYLVFTFVMTIVLNRIEGHYSKFDNKEA